MELGVLKLYVAINGLLILAYALFRFARKSFEGMKGRVSYLGLNRIAQLLVITSIVSPLLFALLPQETIPNIKFEVRTPLADSISTTASPKKKELNLNPQVKDIDKNHTVAHSRKNDFENYLLTIFAIGFLFSLGKLLVNLHRLRRLLENSILIRKIGNVRVLVSDSIRIPFSTLAGPGASVVLPSDALIRSKDVKMIVKHEIHHHRNGDTLWVLAMEFAVCCFYLNPIIYFWKKEITEVQEFACDERLISQMRVSMREYGQCLVHIAESAQGSYPMQVGTTCMGAGPNGPQQLKSFLRRRIEVFQDHQKSKRKNLIGFAFGTVAFIVTAGVAHGAQKSIRSEVATKPNSGVAKFDPTVQKMTEDILKKYVKKFGAKGGFVLVADSQNGRVLAVANQLVGHSKKEKSWALSYEMEPASAMKGIVVASAINQKLIQADDKVDCENGKYIYGGRTYRDWKAFGTLTATELVSVSSNICGIKVGEKLGAKGLESSLKDFGFGPKGVASEFPEAKSGYYPSPDELPVTDYVPLISTGYTDIPGFHVTPLEVLQAYGAIANDGKLMKPINFSDESSSGVVLKHAISSETSKKMRSILAEAVKSGTGKNAQSSLYSTAGKTSTAYRPDSPEHPTLDGERGIAGFVGFAPVENPRVVVYVGIIDPTNSKDRNPHGNEHAAPVFKEVIESVLPKMSVAPDSKTTL